MQILDLTLAIIGDRRLFRSNIPRLSGTFEVPLQQLFLELLAIPNWPLFLQRPTNPKCRTDMACRNHRTLLFCCSGKSSIVSKNDKNMAYILLTSTVACLGVQHPGSSLPLHISSATPNSAPKLGFENCSGGIGALFSSGHGVKPGFSSTGKEVDTFTKVHATRLDERSFILKIRVGKKERCV